MTDDEEDDILGRTPEDQFLYLMAYDIFSCAEWNGWFDYTTDWRLCQNASVGYVAISPTRHTAFSSLFVDNTGETSTACEVRLSCGGYNPDMCCIFVPANSCNVYEIAHRPIPFPEHQVVLLSVKVPDTGTMYFPKQIKLRECIWNGLVTEWMNRTPQYIFRKYRRNILTWHNGFIGEYLADIDLPALSSVPICNSIQDVRAATDQYCAGQELVFFYKWLPWQDLLQLSDADFPQLISSMCVTNQSTKTVRLKLGDPELQHHWYDIPPGCHVTEFFLSEIYQPTRQMMQLRQGLDPVDPPLHIQVRVGWFDGSPETHDAQGLLTGRGLYNHWYLVAPDQTTEYLHKKFHQRFRRRQNPDELICWFYCWSQVPIFQKHSLLEPKLDFLVATFF